MSEATPRVIRAAESDDLEAIGQIYAHHVLHGLASFEETPPDSAELMRRWRAIADAGLPFLCAHDAALGRVLGYAYAAPYRARSAYRFTVEDSVYVAPHAVGRGVGRALLWRLIEICSALGKRQMVAIIGDSGNAASIGLHRACGFAPVGTLHAVGFKHGRWVDSVLMQRSLGEGSASPPNSQKNGPCLGTAQVLGGNAHKGDATMESQGRYPLVAGQKMMLQMRKVKGQWRSPVKRFYRYLSICYAQ